MLVPPTNLATNSPNSISTSLLSCAATSIGIMSSLMQPFVYISNLLNIKKKTPVIHYLSTPRNTRNSNKRPTTDSPTKPIIPNTTESERPSKKTKSSPSAESKSKNTKTNEGKRKHKDKKSSKEKLPLANHRKSNTIVPVIARPSLITHDHQEVVKLIDSIYDPIFDGYRISRSEKRKTNSIKYNRGELDGFGPATYGEIVPSSVSTIITVLNIREDDVFYDLGSGVGKTVIQVALQTRCEKSVGVELSESRYKASLGAKMELQKRLPSWLPPSLQSLPSQLESSIEFHFNDIVVFDLREATCVFWNNLCFPATLSIRLNEKFVRELRPGTRILCSRKLCERHGPKCIRKKEPCSYLELVEKGTVECTWSPQCPIYLYQVMEKE